MSYKPNKATISVLRDIYELEGSYAGVARSLNKGRQSDSNKFTARQVSRMLNRENVGLDDGGYTKENKPLPTNLTTAQQRSLQRKSKETSRTYVDTYEQSAAPNKIYESIKGNIEKARRRNNNEIRELMKKKREFGKAGQDTSSIDKEIEKKRERKRGLNQFDDDLDKTAKNAKEYKDWKGMQDANTP